MNASIDFRSFERACVVCVTAGHELVVLDSICLAVRERNTGRWLEDHSAIDERVTLQPTRRTHEQLADFELVAHTFGLRLLLGRVVAVHAPDDSVCEHLQQASRLGRLSRTWLQRSASDAPALKVA